MLCYYITGHGFGHAVRTTQILKSLPPDLPLVLKTTAPERLFREELPGRAFEYVKAEYDCGCLQSDSVHVLRRETLTRYAEIERRNNEHLADEAAFLQANGVRCVASDIAPFPFRVAQRAGIPSVAVANFTWHDIYAEYVETAEDAALLVRMADDYAAADLACLSPLAVPTVGDVFPQVQPVPLIARRGNALRAELAKTLHLPEGKRLALLYLGGWGLDIDFAALKRFSDWVFLTDAPLPIAVSNARAFDPSVLRYADVAASVDAVVSKAGYGTLTECIANSVPLVYLPRHGFAEHAALVAGMAAWGGGVEMSERDFFAGNWGEALARALSARPNPAAFATNGADVVADILSDTYTRRAI